MASIVKRSKSFCVVYTTTIDGQRKQKWETYYSLAEAEQRKELLELCANTKTEVRRRREQTVENLLTQYVELYGMGRWSPSTYQANCNLIRRYLVPAIGMMRLDELSPRVVGCTAIPMLCTAAPTRWSLSCLYRQANHSANPT